MSHFKSTRAGIVCRFSPEERIFLGDVLPMLADIGVVGEDPAATRLQVPVYLDDPEANEEWWRLMGEELNAARKVDRDVFRRVVEEPGPVTLSDADADSFLRVINEARLALGARLGVEVEEDHDLLAEESRQVLDYLGWILEELTDALSRSL